MATDNGPLVKVQVHELQRKDMALIFSCNFTCVICSMSIGFANISAVKLGDIICIIPMYYYSLRVLVTLVPPHRRGEVADIFSVSCVLSTRICSSD